jgi:hypothetical protein
MRRKRHGVAVGETVGETSFAIAVGETAGAEYGAGDFTALLESNAAPNSLVLYRLKCLVFHALQSPWLMPQSGNQIMTGASADIPIKQRLGVTRDYCQQIHQSVKISPGPTKLLPAV